MGFLAEIFMKLKVIGSGSSGNGYILQSSKNDVLIIEAGMRIANAKKMLNYDISGIRGLIASHIHHDHFLFAKDYATAGIPVYAPSETIIDYDYDHHNLIGIDVKTPLYLGPYKIMAFDLKHDVRCYGYLISHPEMGTTTFITDTHYCQYKFPNLTNIILEANFAIDIVDSKIERGGGNEFIRNRILTSHMEIETTKEFLQSNDLSQVNNILLIHLSNENSDEKRFVNEIKELTGKNVYAAINGLEIDFNLTPF
jgi:ribonuclease BN (tRNA processing enzyme)